MVRQVAPYGMVALTMALLFESGGCAGPTSSSTRIRMQTLCSAGLDGCRIVELTHERAWDRETGQPERSRELLRVAVRPRPQLQFERDVKAVELAPGVAPGKCGFENVEARRDATGQKVWFVQRGTRRIVATIDLETHETTGPDDPAPAWATPEGGEPLGPAAS